ncbi:hypothetical protein MmiEs2_03800 [Methanimicrococcus stummii]|uniref:Uncharacterized protein n=1 Tax=Methanimicrococcus stummii TaxID=3028294 RepID=A0AA96V976_9EURY|nr:hypothetical protein [Methanimicrococcus sp. Es2]WNY28196.1 hypothetical protein MmiEs2_03800 [Methanimicrococcus sp. Es2]
MASNFTTGISEFDRLTENKIENGTFLLLSGNDDEGIASFSAAIEKSNGRPAEEETVKKNKCTILKITPENRHCWKELCFNIKTKTNATQTANQTENKAIQEAFAETDLEMIFFIENLSELFQNESNSKKSALYEERQIISFVREMKADINPQNTKPRNCEGGRYVIIGCLHRNILSKGTEERLNHLADSAIQFQMKENGDKFERRMLVLKYKGAKAGGNILKYVIENEEIQIENKKRIY